MYDSISKNLVKFFVMIEKYDKNAFQMNGYFVQGIALKFL